MRSVRFVILLLMVLMSPGFSASADVVASVVRSSQRDSAIQHLRRLRRHRSFRITAIEALDQGVVSDSAATDSKLDTFKGVCEDEAAEPFFDSLLRVTIANSSSSGLRLRRFRFKVRRGNSDDSTYRSPRYSPIGTLEIEADSSGFVYGPLLEAEEGRKVFAGGDELIDRDLGFRKVKVIVKGITFRRERFRVKGKTTLSFGETDRC